MGVLLSFVLLLSERVRGSCQVCGKRQYGWLDQDNLLQSLEFLEHVSSNLQLRSQLIVDDLTVFIKGVGSVPVIAKCNALEGFYVPQLLRGTLLAFVVVVGRIGARVASTTASASISSATSAIATIATTSASPLLSHGLSGSSSGLFGLFRLSRHSVQSNEGATFRRRSLVSLDLFFTDLVPRSGAFLDGCSFR